MPANMIKKTKMNDFAFVKGIFLIYALTKMKIENEKAVIRMNKIIFVAKKLI